MASSCVAKVDFPHVLTEAARTREIFNAEVFKAGETYYIPQHIAFSSPEIAELIRSNPAVDIQIIKSSSMGKSDGGY